MPVRSKKPPTPEWSFGKAIGWMREELDLQQKEMALRTGVSQATWSRWENDEMDPSVRVLPRLAHALRARISTLLALLNVEREDMEWEDIGDWATRVGDEVAEQKRLEREERRRQLDQLRFKIEPRQDFREMRLSAR